MTPLEDHQAASCRQFFLPCWAELAAEAGLRFGTSGRHGQIRRWNLAQNSSKPGWYGHKLVVDLGEEVAPIWAVWADYEAGIGGEVGQTWAVRTDFVLESEVLLGKSGRYGQTEKWKLAWN